LKGNFLKNLEKVNSREKKLVKIEKKEEKIKKELDYKWK
jgi:hypothetical protein